jgi:hypothetical protein
MELCWSPLDREETVRFASPVRRQVTMLVALADRMNPVIRRATPQPPLAYRVIEFGRPFI